MTVFIVNGQKIEVEPDPRESLLDVLHGLYRAKTCE
jgi:aerobic-type carbon monoxide dehydrogenase small subunit (CoxS/CutS family)